MNIDLINLYNEEGGDIIQMSHYLLNTIREDEEYLVNAERMNRSATIEFAILWSFSLIILAILKYSLSDFFSHIVKSAFYQMSVVCIILFALFSIHIDIKKITDIKIKGWDK